jgi:hypothetical protein
MAGSRAAMRDRGLVETGWKPDSAHVSGVRRFGPTKGGRVGRRSNV